MIHLRAYFLIAILLLSSVVARAAGEPWSEDFTPPPGAYSWVQLDTGEWLKGDIIALYDAVLVFDSDHFGDLQIDLDDILHIYGRGVFTVTFRDGAVVRGQLNMRNQSINIERAGENLEFRRAELISITQAAERERDRWMGNLGVGLNVRQGNTEISEVSITAGLRRRTPSTRMALDYIGNTNETDGERISDSHRVNFSVDRFTGRRLFWRPISVQWYRDELQNIAHQATADTGLGYHLVDSQRVDWELQAGVGGNYLENVSVLPGQANNEWSPVGTLGSDLEIEITSWMDYELNIDMTFLEEQAGKYQHHIVSTLSTDLIGDLDLDIVFIWDRTENPQVDEDLIVPEQDDYRLEVNLAYDF